MGTSPIGSCDHVGYMEMANRLGEAERSVGGLKDGIIYYSLLEVYNYAGGWQTLTSPGVIIDTTPPSCGQIFDGQGIDYLYIGPTKAGANVIETENGTAVVGQLFTLWTRFSDWYVLAARWDCCR